MIAAGVPCGDLREIRRNSGSIVEACADIRDGKPFHTDDRLDFESGKNLKLIATLTPAGNVAAILGTLRSIRRARRLDPVWDCQVLAAVNERSPVSRRDLNRRLREEFNPNGQAIKGCPFRVGDKIICLKNSMMPCEDAEDDATCDDRGRIYVANGELARVMKIFPKYFIATLESPRRVVRVPVGGNGDGNSCQFDLGYAITAHKSQGSEWPVVIVALDDSRGAGFVTNREWFYTAISRAKRACILVGKRATADAMCRRTAIDKRKTFLQELIECQTRM
jgi:exodeoxyribonuclease V alpha subunit